MDKKLILAIIGIVQYVAIQIYMTTTLGKDISSLNFSAAFSDMSHMMGGAGMAIFSISGAIAFFSFIYLVFRTYKYATR